MSTMSPDDWKRAREVLADAIERPAGDRASFLERACAGEPALRREVESLLRAHDEAATRYESAAARLYADAAPPERIGPYRLVDKLGQGGMGAVYLAERDDEAFRQRVAIKLLRSAVAPEEIVRRFLSERQILADLAHPNIAGLIDGGSEQDRPYLVMEHVEGQPIDAYCDARRLSVRQRLEIFLDVCSAVHFAHQSLVVHRDLKPSNVLVTEDGTAKLLDFGIAKILAPETFAETVLPTRPGLTPLTPEYASPEQVYGRSITTASDVYSLGVMLYELLSGRRPYRLESADLESMVEVVCVREPQRPSSRLPRAGSGEPAGAEISALRGSEPGQLRRELTGDLDAVVMMALRKEPGARYPSVAQLADDIRRHLAGHPVRARRSTFTYRTSKFVRRHLLAVSAAVLFVLLMLAFTGLVVRKNLEIQRQTDRAREVVSVLTDVFSSAAPSRAQGETVTVKDALLRAEPVLEQRLAAQPAVHADLLGVIGKTFVGLGLVDQGVRLLNDSVGLHRRADGDGPELAERLYEIAYAEALLGDYSKAEDHGRESWRLRLRLFGDLDSRTVQSMAFVGHLRDLQGDYAGAGELFAQALTLAEQIGDGAGIAEVLWYFAHLEKRQDHLEGSRRKYAESLELLRRQHGDKHPKVVEILHDLAVLDLQADAAKAERLLRQSLAIQNQIYDGAHPLKATTLNNLAKSAAKQGRVEEAEQLFQESLAMKRDLYGELHSKIGSGLADLAELFSTRGRWQQAESTYRDACRMLKGEVDEHNETALCFNGLASVLLAMERAEEADALYLKSLEISIDRLGENHSQVGLLRRNLADLRRRQGDLEAASAFAEGSVEVLRRVLGNGHEHSLEALTLWAQIEKERGRLELAAQLFEENLEARRAGGGDQVEIAKIRYRVADLRLQLDAPLEARQLARGAREVLGRELGPSDLWSLAAQGVEGMAEMHLGDTAAAERLLEDRLDRLRALPSPPAGSLRAATEQLATLYETTGRRRQGEALRRRLEGPR